MATAKIASKLNTLNSTYLGGVENAFLGSDRYVNSAFNNTDLTAKYLNRIFTNVATADDINFATNAYNLSSTLNVNVFNPTDATVDRPYSSVALNSFSSSSYNFTNDANTITTDINCIELMMPHGNGLSSIPQSVLCLQALYAWYTLLDTNNWQLYLAGQVVTLNVPDILPGDNSTSSKFTSVTITNVKNIPTSTSKLTTQLLITDTSSVATTLKTSIASLMSYYIPFSIFNTPNFNPFVARRLIHLYIIMFHFNTAITYYTAYYAISGNTFTSTPALLDALFKLLEYANINVTDQDGTFNEIVTAVQKRAAKYNTSQQQITKLDGSLSSLKDDIAKNSNNLNSRLQYQEKVKKYQTAAIVMLAIISAGAAVLFITPLEYKQKISGGAMLVILAVLTAFILQYQNNKTTLHEGFVYDTAGGVKSLTKSGVTWTDASSEYSTQMQNEALKYLDNTLLLTTTLDSYHIYGNVNTALDKEQSFFSDSVTSLTMKDTNMKDVYNISYMDQIRFSALMNLSISLSLIIAVTVTISLALEGYPELRKYVMIIGLILAIIAVIIYILEISSRVHTHPKQRYWAANTEALKTLQ
jgi:membrane protein YdbS with pleckstrin-like domain